VRVVSEASRARLEELLAQRRYATALDSAVNELSGLGLSVARDDAVSKEAVAAALSSALEQDKFHLVWHRVWGVRLRSELIETTDRLAGLLDGERGTFVWGVRPSVGFVVSVAAALRSLPEHIGPAPGDVGPRGVASDLLLVGDDGRSGLRLEYIHRSNADEYELRSWGRYAIPVAS
jgi:hypothetical protein